MLKWLLKSLLITAVFVPLATALPVASLRLCRDPVGGQIVFWAGPWSCAFWTLILSVLVGSRFWRGAASVKAWRAERGGYVRSCLKSTAVMFLALFLSYGAEFLFIFTVPGTPTMRMLLPFVTYSPAIFAAIWSAA